MKTGSFFAAVAAVSFVTAALASQAAADYQVIALDKRYSGTALGAICARAGGLPYHAGHGTYGCRKDSNIVECRSDGLCRGFTASSFALVASGAANHRMAGAEAVLQAPSVPWPEDLATSAERAFAAPQ